MSPESVWDQMDRVKGLDVVVSDPPAPRCIRVSLWL